MEHDDWLNNTNYTTAEWLDRFFQYAFSESNMFGSEDEAIERLYNMKSSDWEMLANYWPTRSEDWKEECAGILGAGPDEGRFLLKSALSDNNPEIRLWAASSYSRLILNMMDDLDEEQVEVDEDTQLILKQSLDIDIPVLEFLLEDIKELLSRLQGL